MQQGSRLIIVVVQLGVVKIYVAALEALMKKERQDETQFTTKVDGFWVSSPLELLFLQVFFKSHPVYDQTQGSGAVFFLLYG